MITYDPKDASRCWDEGEYQATLLSCEEAQSKAGNPMYVVTFEAHRNDETMTLKDYVVVPQFVWKLKRLAAALGVPQLFEDGTFDPTVYEGHNVQVMLGIEKKAGFDDRNKITKYLPKDGSGKSPVAPDDDADLPF